MEKNKEKLSQVLESRFMSYAMSVIISRALPELIDGFKPSQRKVLWTMYRQGLLNGNRTKGANIAGASMTYNPHSSDSNYLTAVRMEKSNETLLTPFIDGKGSFGKHYSSELQCAAARYVEMKLAPVANELFKNIKKNPDNLVPNYDETTYEPKILPLTFPNILANPNKGVAVAFTCDFPSFNLVELCNATIEIIKHFNDKDNKNITRLLKILPAPDFTSGAQLLYDENSIKELYSNGTASLMLRSKFKYNKKENILEIIEIPFSTTAEVIIDDIIKAIKEGRIKDVVDVRDEISKDGFKIALDLKKGTDIENLKKRLFSLTKVQDTYACNLTLIHNGNPKQMGVLEILKNWIIWRREEVKIEVQYDLNEKEKLLHLLLGLEKILLNIEKAVEIVKKSKNDKEVIDNLMKYFKIDEVQANYVAEIKLRNFNKEYLLNKTKEIENIKKEIETLKEILSSGIDKKIISELNYVAKTYGQPRKSEIVYEYQVVSEKYSAKALDENQEFKVFYNNEEIRKFDKDSKATLPEGYKEFNCKGKDEILVFANNGNVHKIKISKLKGTKKIESLIDLEVGSEIIFITPLLEKDLVILFENGKLARFSLSVYKTISNTKCLKKGYNVLSPIVYLKVIENEEMLIIKTKGKEQKLSTKDYLTKATRTTQGVQAIKKKFLPLPKQYI